MQERWPLGRPLVGKLSTMVLVHGIHKKTQKAPPADIALAQRRMKEGT